MDEIKKIDFDFIKSKKTDKVIIGFHGWQGNKDSFKPLVKNSLFEKFNWLLVPGPYKVNNNPLTRTWSYELEPNKWAYREPQKLIEDFFNNTVFKKFKSKNVYVIGFSLGALVCYEYICSINKPLGGIFPIAGFMRGNNVNLNKNQMKTPIIIGHGKSDSIVPIKRSEEAYHSLQRQKANVELITYEAQHNIPISMLTKISQKIKKKHE